MMAEQQTVRVPHCVAKQVPTTYTCNVPRLVCYRVPLDACGEPIVESPAPAASAGTIAVPSPQPTPAKKPAGGDVKPELGPDVGAPRPLDGEEKQPQMTPVQPLQKPVVPAPELNAPKST